jgi:hypothetical protein
MFFAKMRSARFFPMQRVITQQLGIFEKISHPPRIFQRLIECGSRSEHRDLVLMDEEKATNVMLCVSRTRTPELVIDR